MHELGIIEEVLAAVCERAGDASIVRVVLEVGELSAVMPDALRFAFEVAREGTAAEGAVLEVREVAARAKCGACGAEFRPDARWALCACGGADLAWLAGHELRVVEMEVSDVRDVRLLGA